MLVIYGELQKNRTQVCVSLRMVSNVWACLTPKMSPLFAWPVLLYLVHFFLLSLTKGLF